MAKKKEKLSVFVALDRSGSMSGVPWTNGIEGLNSYVAGLKNEKIEGDITVVAFDSYTDSSSPYVTMGISPNINPGLGNTMRKPTTDLVTLANQVDITSFVPISPSTIQPRGGTPLFDAAANVMDRALAKNSKKTVVIIITDGHENSSVEYTQAKIKNKVEHITSRGWEVIFLGANFDVSGYTAASGLGSGKMMNFDIHDVAATRTMSNFMSANSATYLHGGAIDLTVKVDVKNNV